MTIAMMIDIETLSLKPTAYVTQVGYCVANLDTGEYLLNPTSWRTTKGQPHADIDFDTVRWWVQQDKAVAASVFGFDANPAPVQHPMMIAGEIAKALDTHDVQTVWASPAMFDLPILTHLWHGQKPWVYNQERCLMTLYKTIDPEGALKPPPNEMHHDAAADAKWQMDYLIRLHQFLRDSGKDGGAR